MAFADRFFHAAAGSFFLFGPRGTGRTTWLRRHVSERLYVDLFASGSSGFWAIEVKNAGAVRPADVRPLRAFREDYPECEPLLLYRGTDRLEVGGIRCVPIEAFLAQIRPGHGLTAGL